MQSGPKAPQELHAELDQPETEPHRALRIETSSPQQGCWEAPTH